MGNPHPRLHIGKILKRRDKQYLPAGTRKARSAYFSRSLERGLVDVFYLLFQFCDFAEEHVVCNRHFWVIEHVSDDPFFINNDVGMPGQRTSMH